MAKLMALVAVAVVALATRVAAKNTKQRVDLGKHDTVPFCRYHEDTHELEVIGVGANGGGCSLLGQTVRALSCTLASVTESAVACPQWVCSWVCWPWRRHMAVQLHCQRLRSASRGHRPIEACP